MNGLNLTVTRGGDPLPNQNFGIRLFKDACRGDRYRIAWSGGRWHVYHSGRIIEDGPRDSVGSILNYLARVRA